MQACLTSEERLASDVGEQIWARGRKGRREKTEKEEEDDGEEEEEEEDVLVE